MPAVARELKITYGAFVVGGTTDRLIDGYIRMSKSFEDASVEFDFVISATTEALFQDGIEECEAAFRKPFQDFKVELGSETILDYSHSTNTGFNTQPSIMKQENILDTGRSRRYTIEISCGMPADAGVPQTGIRESDVNVAYSPSRKRTVSISGVATALGGDAARAEYESIIDSYCTGITGALGGTYELADEPTTNSDYADKTISFTRIFDEIIYSQGGSADDAAIVRQIFSVTRSKVAPGDFPGSGAERLVTLLANFSCWIDKDVTQDLRGKWDSVRSWVYDQIKATFNTGSLAITEVAPTFDYTDNRISGRVTALVATGSKVISTTQTNDLADDLGKVLTPVWSGNKFCKYLYQGPATRIRTVTTNMRLFGGVVEANQAAEGAQGVGQGFNGIAVGQGGVAGAAFGGLGQNMANPPGQGGFVGAVFNFPQAGAGGDDQQEADAPAGTPKETLMSTRRSTTPLRIGRDGHEFDVTDIMDVKVYQWYAPPLTAPWSGGTPPTVALPAGQYGL